MPNPSPACTTRIRRQPMCRAQKSPPSRRSATTLGGRREPITHAAGLSQGYGVWPWAVITRGCTCMARSAGGPGGQQFALVRVAGGPGHAGTEQGRPNLPPSPGQARPGQARPGAPVIQSTPATRSQHTARITATSLVGSRSCRSPTRPLASASAPASGTSCLGRRSQTTPCARGCGRGLHSLPQVCLHTVVPGRVGDRVGDEVAQNAKDTVTKCLADDFLRFSHVFQRRTQPACRRWS
jgi:hypothetical protein